jgi:hypothetical protein
MAIPCGYSNGGICGVKILAKVILNRILIY